MTVLTLNLNGVTNVIDTGRPLSGGVAHTDLGTFLTALVNLTAPNVVPVTCAANATVNLVSKFNTILTTANGTIPNAVFNFPTSPTDGTLVRFVTSGAVSNVTGTVNTAVPAVTSTSAGVPLQYRYDTASGKWLVA